MYIFIYGSNLESVVEKYSSCIFRSGASQNRNNITILRCLKVPELLRYPQERCHGSLKWFLGILRRFPADKRFQPRIYFGSTQVRGSGSRLTEAIVSVLGTLPSIELVEEMTDLGYSSSYPWLVGQILRDKKICKVDCQAKATLGSLIDTRSVLNNKQWNVRK